MRQLRRIPYAAVPLVMWTGAVIAQELESCRILGRVIDAEFGDGIAGASVWLQSADGLALLAGTTTSADGTFSVEARACGAVELRSRKIGYTGGFELVEFDGAGEVHQTTVRLERSPLQVEELRVEVPTSLRLQEVGFYARKAWEESTGRDYGQFYDPDEVAGRSASYHSVGAMALAARIFFMYPKHALCREPSFYVDGRRFERRYDFRAWLDHAVKLDEVEGLEIYRPVHGAIPDAFRDANANLCGLVLIWTKHGGRGEVPKIEVELCEPSGDTGVFTLGGIVTDRVTGVRLPASYVTLVTRRVDAGSAELETVTDSEGRFRYCDLDAVPESVRARYGDAAGAVRELTESTVASGEVHLEVPVTRPGVLTGRVVGQDMVPDSIVVTLDGTDLRAKPDSLGVFGFEDIPFGDYVVTVTSRGQIVIRREVLIRSEATEWVELEIDR